MIYQPPLGAPFKYYRIDTSLQHETHGLFLLSHLFIWFPILASRYTSWQLAQETSKPTCPCAFNFAVVYMNLTLPSSTDSHLFTLLAAPKFVFV